MGECSGLNDGSHKDMSLSQSLEPVSITIFALIYIKDLDMRRSPWITLLGPKSNDH